MEVLEAEGTGLTYALDKGILCNSAQVLSSQALCPQLEDI